MKDDSTIDRRTFAMLGLSAAAVAAAGRSGRAEDSEDPDIGDTWMEARSGDIPVFFENSDAEFQFVRALGAANADAAALGECITVVRRIAPVVNAIEPSLPDYLENYFKLAGVWAPAWTELAGKVESWADDSAKKGDEVSARAAYLRATAYYRTAELVHPAAGKAGAKAVNARGSRCFLEAGKRFDGGFEALKFPYEGTELPGYLITPDKTATRRPTFLCFTGFDGSSEEVFFWAGVAAIERGYNVALFDGPGHRAVLHEDPKMVFRPDYNVPVSAFIDYLTTRTDVVDPDQIALCGCSFSGGLSARAAAEDHRIAAYVSYPPMIDNYKAFGEAVPEEMFDLEAPPHPAWVMGVKTLGELVEAMKPYNYRADAARIKAPTLVLWSSGEGPLYKKHAEEFYRDLNVPKAIHGFKPAEGAAAHCSVNNIMRFNQVMFDWLDEALKWRG